MLGMLLFGGSHCKFDFQHKKTTLLRGKQGHRDRDPMTQKRSPQNGGLPQKTDLGHAACIICSLPTLGRRAVTLGRGPSGPTWPEAILGPGPFGPAWPGATLDPGPSEPS